MNLPAAPLSTGLPGLDRALTGLLPGDNVVLQVEDIADYTPFVRAFGEEARRRAHPLVYFRFARHAPLFAPGDGIHLCQLRPEEGFETFIASVHKAIAAAGPGADFAFDCLSDLAADWYSDTMLGNFFTLTCPYLFDIEALAYFALFRNRHSFRATTPITDTAQVVLDIYRRADRLYVHPVRATQRFSPTLFMLHAWDDDEFRPVTQSAEVAAVLTGGQAPSLESPRYRMGVWRRTFFEAERLRDAGRNDGPPSAQTEITRRLLRMALTRDERMLALAERYFRLEDLLAIGRRIIGTGLVGGKAVGMLLARAVLRATDPAWEERLEPHDSYHVGADVFYTFLVRNGLWWAHQKQRDPAHFLEEASRARQRMLTGSFPDYILEQFCLLIDYFGQSPIIVRSSSLLEDNYGNAFAGQYESVFCANQGSRERRLQEFLAAVRTVYASSMSERALLYRLRRGILDRDEQMALLVQRVSGNFDGDLFYPQVAGVGFSHNPYAWSPAIDPKAGMLRLVCGLGTRAVDRTEDDCTRLVALNAPSLQPEHRGSGRSQRRMDVIDLRASRLASREFSEVARAARTLPLDLVAGPDEEAERMIADGRAKDLFPWRLDFATLLEKTPFAERMRALLGALQAAYGAPVDIEYTANADADGNLRINLLQCRPLAMAGEGRVGALPAEIPEVDLLFRARGAVIGTSRDLRLDRIIGILPAAYAKLTQTERYAVARLVGRLVRAGGAGATLLLGPGRWGTTTPSLGIPVSFGEISKASVICEIVAMRDDLVPDVSLGTHFFTELVEWDILYLALFPGREGNLLREGLFARFPNALSALAPEEAHRGEVVRVIESSALPSGRKFRLVARAMEQDVVCYVAGPDDA